MTSHRLAQPTSKHVESQTKQQESEINRFVFKKVVNMHLLLVSFIYIGALQQSIVMRNVFSRNSNHAAFQLLSVSLVE